MHAREDGADAHGTAVAQFVPAFMAHLNLRERVIETTIAYLGAEIGAGATNFAHVRRDQSAGRAGALQETVVGGGRLISLDWRPRDGARLNDCELRVRLVSTEGPVDPAAVQRLLVDADGLVLVLESDVGAAEQNRRAIATLRDALARTPEKKVPVVVQVNQRDGIEAQSNFHGVVADDWPLMRACTAKGDGVMETLKRAVDVVVESMQRHPNGEASVARPAGAPRAEGNPLLGALRQILQATVSEQIAALETRLAERIDRRAGPLETTQDTGGGLLGEIRELRSLVVDELAVRIEALAAESSKASARMGRIEGGVVDLGQRATMSREPTASRGDVLKFQTLMAAELSARCDALVGELREYRKAVHDELTRVVLVGTQPLILALHELSSKIQEWTARESDLDVAGALGRLGHSTDGARRQVESLVTESRAVASRLDAVASRMQDIDAESGRRLAEMRDSLQTANERADRYGESIQAELAALGMDLRTAKQSEIV